MLPGVPKLGLRLSSYRLQRGTSAVVDKCISLGVCTLPEF